MILLSKTDERLIDLNIIIVTNMCATGGISSYLSLNSNDMAILIKVWKANYVISDFKRLYCVNILGVLWKSVRKGMNGNEADVIGLLL